METEETISLKDAETKESTHPNTISEVLKASGHQTYEYPNGLCCGVRLESIPGTRGVHVDVVHVLDLRTAEYGTSGLAMRAAILEGVNRPLSGILSDIGLGGILDEKSVLTPFGRVPLLQLENLTGTGASLVHETRTVYVVREDARTSLDLSWLTDSSRIITATDLSLARKSDIRAMLPSLRAKIVDAKWDLLETTVKRGWLGAIALVGIAISLVSLAMVVLIGSGTTLIPLVLMTGSTLVGGSLLASSKKALNEFTGILASEEEGLLNLGDKKCIDTSISENASQLRLLGDISFVVSPLMAVVGLAIESSDVNEAATNACQVLDECVRLAPLRVDTKEPLSVLGDEGLRRFLGLFDTLGVQVEEEELALAYVALTGHDGTPLSFSELVRHIEVLNNTLYNAGALRPDIKESVDDRINQRAMKAVVAAIDKSIEDEIESTQPVIVAESVETPSEDSVVEATSEDETAVEEVNPDFLTEIRESSAVSTATEQRQEGETVESSNTIASDTEVQDEQMPSAADVVMSQRTKKDKADSVMVQSSLFDSVSDLMELGQDQGVEEEEGGPAGA